METWVVDLLAVDRETAEMILELMRSEGRDPRSMSRSEFDDCARRWGRVLADEGIPIYSSGRVLPRFPG